MLPFFSQSFSNIQKITIAVAEIHQLKQIPENIEVFKEEIYQKFTINPITLGEVQKQHHVVENGNGRATVVYRINFTGDKDLFFYSRKEI